MHKKQQLRQAQTITPNDALAFAVRHSSAPLGGGQVLGTYCHRSRRTIFHAGIILRDHSGREGWFPFTGDGPAWPPVYTKTKEDQWVQRFKEPIIIQD